MSRIIFLHGASSSGKSTLALAIQQRLDQPFWHLSIDHFRESGSLPMARYRTGEFDWASDRAAIFDGFHRSVAACADAGNNLILEHILDTAAWAETLRRLLKPHDVLFVALHCPMDVLAEREHARGDRPMGSAVRDQTTIHTGRIYDLELDSTDGVGANVESVLKALRSGDRRSEFHNAQADPT